MIFRNTYLVAMLAVSLTLALPHLCLGQPKKKQEQDEPKVKLLVPNKDLPPYHLFQDTKEFVEIEYPKSKFPDAITSFDQLKGKASRQYKLKAFEPISASGS